MPVPLSLHQLEVVKDVCKPVVPAAALVEDILWRDADGEPARVDDLEAVRVQVQVDVAPLCVGPVNERVDEQLADDELVVGRQLRAQHAVGQLVAFAEVGHLGPDGVDQLDGRLRAVVPAPLRDLHPAFIVLDGLHDRSAPEVRAIVPAADE
ncbi:MAG TPA: hypothetical protein PK177_01470 [Burkholderiaceae bacterium]|nr:hypothetical protein [Burkholderiaceae bacterium]